MLVCTRYALLRKEKNLFISGASGAVGHSLGSLLSCWATMLSELLVQKKSLVYRDGFQCQLSCLLIFNVLK